VTLLDPLLLTTHGCCKLENVLQTANPKKPIHEKSCKNHLLLTLEYHFVGETLYLFLDHVPYDPCHLISCTQLQTQFGHQNQPSDTQNFQATKLTPLKNAIGKRGWLLHQRVGDQTLYVSRNPAELLCAKNGGVRLQLKLFFCTVACSPVDHH